MTNPIPQLKADLLKEIEDYLGSKGVKGEDLKQRIKKLKEKCPPDLRYNLLVLKEYYGEKKDPIQYDNDGKAIIKQNNQEEIEMGDRVELQKKIDALKKLNKAQLTNIAKEGRYMGVKFDPFTIGPGTDIKSNVKSIAYELQDAMGLGSDKAKANQEAESKPPAAKKAIPTKTAPTRTIKPAAKAGNPAINKAFMDAIDTPLKKAKEALKAEKEKSKGIIADLRAKGKEDLAKAAEKLREEKEKSKIMVEALKRRLKTCVDNEKEKSKLALGALREKAGKDLSRLQVRLSLSLENERKLTADNKRLLVVVREDNKKMSLDLRKEEKLKTDLAKGIKFLEKLI